MVTYFLQMDDITWLTFRDPAAESEDIAGFDAKITDCIGGFDAFFIKSILRFDALC